MFGRTSKSVGWVWYQIHWSRPVDARQMQDLLTRAASDDMLGETIFETRVTEKDIIFLVATLPSCAPDLKRIFEAIVPNTVLEQITEAKIETVRPHITSARSIGLGHPMIGLDSTQSILMSTIILTALVSASHEEKIVLQVVLGRATYSPFDIPEKLGDPRERGASAFIRGRDSLSRDARSDLRHRYSMHGFPVEVRIGVTAHSKTREYWLLEQVKSGLKLMEVHGETIDFLDTDVAKELQAPMFPRRWRYALSSAEVACLIGVPYGENDFPGIVPIHPRILRTPTSMSKSVRSFAVTNDPARHIPIGISSQDSLRHVLLLGPTGVGKSTAMLNMILNDISEGLGVIVIDPKGDLNSDILARMDLKRANDVVYIDPTADRVVGINPLAGEGDSDLIADGVLTVLRETFASSWGQRMEDVLSNSLITLMRTTERATVSMLPILLSDAKFREPIVAKMIEEDPLGVGSFWRQYETMPLSKQQELVAPIMNKLRTILTRKPLLRTIGQPRPSFHLKELFTDNKIVLVSLNKADIGATSAQFLGSIILSQVWALTRAQGSIQEEKRPIVKVYVDEMQDYLALPIDIADALSQARGYHVGFTLAHQYRDQVKDKELLSGIDANIAHKVIFGLNGSDAHTMAAMSDVLEPSDFRKLPRHHVYIQTSHKEKSIWLSAETHSAQDPVNNVDRFKQFSLQQYGRRAEAIDREILSSYLG